MLTFTMTGAEQLERLELLDGLIARYSESINGLHVKLRRLRADRSMARARYEIGNYEFWRGNCINERLAIVDPIADVEFVTSAGKRLVGVVCPNCGKPVQMGCKPVSLSRRGGVWTMRCYICNDAKFEW